jgi:hypothetical protein
MSVWNTYRWPVSGKRSLRQHLCIRLVEESTFWRRKQIASYMNRRECIEERRKAMLELASFWFGDVYALIPPGSR